MLEGLRKGSETIKQNALNNLIEHTCPVCGRIFKTRKWNSHTYCSIQCVGVSNKNELVKKSKIASEVIHQKYLETKQERLKLIEAWIIEHKEIIMSAKLNDLKFLKDLAEYIGVKDTRSLGKVLDTKYKKDIIKKLQNIIKCTPNI